MARETARELRALKNKSKKDKVIDQIISEAKAFATNGQSQLALMNMHSIYGLPLSERQLVVTELESLGYVVEEAVSPTHDGGIAEYMLVKW